MQFRIPAAIAALAVAVAVSSAPARLEAQAAATKIGYVDSRAIMEQAPGREAAQQAFEREASGWRTQVQQMQDSLQKLVANYQREQGNLTAAQRQTRENSIRTTEEAFGNRTQQLNQQAQTRQQQLMQPILDGVKTVLEEVRTAEGYALVLDVAAGPMVVAADKNLDLTERVVTRLKARPAPQVGRAAPAPQAAPAAGGPVAPRPAGAARPNSPPRN
jgi:outer membrane protein